MCDMMRTSHSSPSQQLRYEICIKVAWWSQNVKKSSFPRFYEFFLHWYLSVLSCHLTWESTFPEFWFHWVELCWLKLSNVSRFMTSNWTMSTTSFYSTVSQITHLCISSPSSLARVCTWEMFFCMRNIYFSHCQTRRGEIPLYDVQEELRSFFQAFVEPAKIGFFFRNTIHNDTWWGKKRMKNFSSPDSDIATEGNFPKNVTEWACEDDKDKLTKSAKKKMFFSCREMLSNIVSMMWTVVSNLWLMITNRKNHTEKCENVFSAHFIPQINESTLTSVAPCPIHICDSLEKFNLSPLQISAE